MKIGKEKCKCGHHACGTWWLTGIGRFVQGSGFSENEANDIMRKLGSHDEMISSMRECAWMIEQNEGKSDEDDAAIDRYRAVLAKAGTP